MNKNLNRLIPFLLLAALVTWYGCKKEAALTVPAAQAHFTNQTGGSYFITAPGITYKVPIGITTASNVSRTVNISITSPTGAVQGTHYTVNKTSFVIPAGQVIDTLVITGNFAQYTAARKDTLVIKIEGTDKGSSVAASEYNSTFRLFMRGPCSELEVADANAINAFLGAYTRTNEVYGTAYGPYRTTVTAATRTSATTATLTITNVYDWDWGPVQVVLDWTDINNRRVTVPTQNAGGNAGNTFGATYAGQNYALRQSATQVGTFSFCNQTISFAANIGVWASPAPLFSGTLYTVSMQR